MVFVAVEMEKGTTSGGDPVNSFAILDHVIVQTQRVASVGEPALHHQPDVDPELFLKSVTHLDRWSRKVAFLPQVPH